MAARLRPAAREEVAAARARVEAGTVAKADLKLLTKHYLALMEAKAPGKSVEIRVPPFAAVQCIEGVRHTRGTPPAVIETDAATWISVATGTLTWDEALAAGTVRASGERTDLAQYLPLG
ncbi:sterol carrier family protein [Nocardioides nematodiphilus]|uniref:sterol carrier family protein n=1 Tax=Nocardioides nematodiphilus TaxID=2849669 RepID=UPI001CDA25E3|nr:sterol carrier family protein [Nocardioides nematodiphilus]MCA1983387.1 sterol carrier family protein [Nocardioides nematodiphilus]